MGAGDSQLTEGVPATSVADTSPVDSRYTTSPSKMATAAGAYAPSAADAAMGRFADTCPAASVVPFTAPVKPSGDTCDLSVTWRFGTGLPLSSRRTAVAVNVDP